MTLCHLVDLGWLHVDRRVSQSMVMLLNRRVCTRKRVVDSLTICASLSLLLLKLCTAPNEVRVLPDYLLLLLLLLRSHLGGLISCALI